MERDERFTRTMGVLEQYVGGMCTGKAPATKTTTTNNYKKKKKKNNKNKADYYEAAVSFLAL